MHLFTFKKVKCGLPGAFNRDIYDPDLSYFLPTVFADHLYIQKYETDIIMFLGRVSRNSYLSPRLKTLDLN